MPTAAVADFGPIYAETNLSRFPAEPWNTCSNVAFLTLLIYWAWRTRLALRQYPLIVGSLPVLLVGFIGGSLYNATRASSLWLILDFVPIFILTLSAAIWFWYKLIGNRLLAVLLAPTYTVGD
jgi:hemolysin III